MTKKDYHVIVMGFEGSIIRERPDFKTIEEAVEYSNCLGSKWFFYPFVFIVKGKTIRDAPFPITEAVVGRRLKTIAHLFLKTSKEEVTENMNADQYLYYIHQKLIKA